MIATFLINTTVHAVFQVGREGLKVKTHGYCPTIGNAADGTFQIPEWVFDGRPTYQPMGAGGATWQVCMQCTTVLKRLREPPR